MRQSLLGAAALTAGAIGGAVLGYLAERTVVDPALEAATEDTDGHRVTFTTPDGTELAGRVSGPEDAPRIVLVHGLSLSREIWAAQRRALEPAYRVVTVDLRGHGDSADAATGDYSLCAIGSDITTVLDAVGGQRCVLVGHSMGGMAVLAGLAGRPDLVGQQVAGVVLVNSAASAVVAGVGPRSMLAGVAFVRERARSSLVGRMIYGGLDAEGNPRGNDLATVVTRMLGVGPNGRDDAVELVRRLVLASRAHVAAELWRTAGTVDLVDGARLITVPSLVIGGARDRVLPPDHSRRLAATLPDAELLLLPDVGHVAMLERPDDVSSSLEAFAHRALSVPAGTTRTTPR
ncbi:MAG: alpha/beta hydrolase [Actinobacteria bacterium]|nr:alpha/beta hydrolase [Actinomycetota bacterium]